jgi:hypothetical protein
VIEIVELTVADGLLPVVAMFVAANVNEEP